MDGVDGTPTVANRYHYADNDPLNFVDPLGLCRARDGDFSFDGGAPVCEDQDAGAQCAAEGGTHIYLPTGECVNLNGSLPGVCSGPVQGVVGTQSMLPLIQSTGAAAQGDNDAALDYLGDFSLSSGVGAGGAYTFGYSWERYLLPNSSPSVWRANGLRLARPVFWVNAAATYWDFTCEMTSTQDFWAGVHAAPDQFPEHWDNFWNRFGDGAGRVGSWVAWWE